MHWLRLFGRQGLFKYDTAEKRLLRKHFDLLRNAHATVPLYADACALLVFASFSASYQRAEKGFRHAEKTPDFNSEVGSFMT